MSKYDAMISRNRDNSRSKVELAVGEIRKMVAENEEVKISSLVKRTKLSRSFFYTNAEVCKELSQAKEKQKGICFSGNRNRIFERSLLKELEVIKKQNIEKDMIIEKLATENLRLRQAQERQQRAVIRAL